MNPQTRCESKGGGEIVIPHLRNQSMSLGKTRSAHAFKRKSAGVNPEIFFTKRFKMHKST